MSERLDASVAIIPLAKITGYLLSTDHPLGRFKAEYFYRLGYSRLRGEDLLRDLRQHLAVGMVEFSGETRFGRKYRVSGRIRGPNGRDAPLISVWIILNGESVPRLVTAYPGA